MNLKQIIPARQKLKYRILKRYLKDVKTGHVFKFAKAHLGKYLLPHSISITQPIKKSYLYENKIHNLKIASNKISRVVVRPNQILSFWKIIGEPTSQNDYKKGRNIISGNMKEDYGGGLCQLSGIIYYLAIKSGLEIVERHNHSIDIYTDSSRFAPLGTDATIVYGYKDLRIKNNFKNAIRFNFQINANSITASIFTRTAIEERNIIFDKKIKNDIIEVVGRSKKEVINISTYKA